jgi:hypothetical protein
MIMQFVTQQIGQTLRSLNFKTRSKNILGIAARALFTLFGAQIK